MQDVTRNTVGAIEEIRKVIGRMGEIATTIASAVEQQSASTQEIARNAHQAAQGTEAVSCTTGGVQARAESIGTAASHAAEAARFVRPCLPRQFLANSHKALFAESLWYMVYHNIRNGYSLDEPGGRSGVLDSGGRSGGRTLG